MNNGGTAMHDRYDYGMSWGGVVLMGLVLVLLVGLAVGLVVWLVTRPTSALPTALPPAAGSTARAILDERFARGEIDEDEYRRRRGILDGG